MRLGVRAKLVLLSLLILVVVSFSFTWLQIRLSRAWFEEDLRARAVIFAREVAATIGDRREFENRDMLAHKIRQIMAIRQSVFQLDVLGFDKAGSHIVATSYEPRRLPFTRREGEQVRQGDVVSRMVTDQDGRSWEVMAPIRVEGDVVGAIAAKFSLSLAAAREARLRGWDLALTGSSVLLMGSLMGLAVHVVVNRPIRRLVDARSEEHTSELQSPDHLVCRLLLEKKNQHDVAADPRWPASGIGAVVTKPIKASPLHAAVATVLGTTQEDGAEGAASALDEGLASRHPLRILLAEDNVVNQKLAIRLLEKLGYRADIVANGLEALEAVERQTYDLLLSDVQMPEMDGLEATRQILERWPEGERPWIIAMTAEAMSGDRERCLEAGMND